jgi:NADH:ubiquinone oxidoreductase subunit F (NADH-binding)/(2Fe-2S) ferredoxin
MPKGEKGDLDAIAAKERERTDGFRCRMYACASTGCVSSGCETVREALEEAIAAHELSEQVEIVPTGCMGLCSRGPLVQVEVRGQQPVLYQSLEPLVARLVVAEHVAPALALQEGETFAVPAFLQQHTLSLELPFFAKQEKIVLANAGHMDPSRLEAYVARNGYRALRKAVVEMTPEEVIEQLKTSGLRGRGGGGFPTGLKWENTRKSEGTEKFVICNGDEGDPGAYMDRSILEGDPHAVIEGMALAGYATGASMGWFYIRAEYPLAVERVQKAIRQAKREGILGKSVLGSDFAFECDVRLGAGAFVCGEETALLASLEGKRGTPRPRPPYPSQAGLWGRPTCVNNVETLANVAPILRNGADWYAGIGTESSKGTKVFALTGKATYTGLIEVPMGITLREIAEELAGGTDTGRPLKAVQTGGPSGGVIPGRLLETPVCYEELKRLGSIMGSGGLIIMDEADSMVDIARFYLDFTVDESCGKCAACRIGGTQMLTILDRFRAGEAAGRDIPLLRRLAEAMQQASLCGLGQTAPNPVVSTLQYFEDEYIRQIPAVAREEA